MGTVEVDVDVVEEEEEEDFEAARATWMPGSTAKEMIRAKISNDRDFMKTLQAANLRY